MKKRSRISIWPFVCIVICLTVLTLLAPRAWYSALRWQAARRPAAAPQNLPADDDGFAPNRSMEIELIEQLATTTLDELLPAPQTADLSPPVADRVPALLVPQIEAIAEPEPSTAKDEIPSDQNLPPIISPSDVVGADAPRIPKQDSVFDPARPHIWPEPTAAIRQLESLAEEAATQRWVVAVLDELSAISNADSLAAAELPDHFDRLEKLIEASNDIDAQIEDPYFQSELRKTVYGLIKRLQVWRQVNQVAVSGPVLEKIEHDDARMLQLVSLVAGRLQPLRHAESWRNYLLLDRVASLAIDDSATADRQQTAAVLLTQLESSELSDRQIEFLASEEIRAYMDELRRWAARPIDLPQMLAALERRELNPNDSDSTQLADAVQVLRWSPREDLVELGKMVEAHYRNANVRVAVSVDLINRMLPAPPPRSFERVDDRISGARVFGDSEAKTDRFVVRLLPDRSRLRMALETRGLVASETSAYSGPVRFFNEGLAMFRVRKNFLIDRRGIRTYRAEAEAHSNAQVTGLETEWDGFPLVSMLVRSIAMQQHDQQAGYAKSEVEQKLEAQVSNRLDREVQQQLMTAERRLQQKVLMPLRQLKLDPVPVAMQTTAERLIVRYRLAGDDQLAAHTPRPQAPSGSLMSMQLHESIVNNAIEKLQLAGRRSTIEEIVRDVAAAAGRSEIELPEDFPREEIIEFAESDPVRVEFHDGRVLLTLRIAELSGSIGSLRNFSVQTEYFPEIAGLDVRLGRASESENVISIDSLNPNRRLPLSEWLALRGIFTKVLSKNRKLPLMPDAIKSDQRLADLRVSQFVVEDGWVGVALGPRPVQSHLSDRPQFAPGSPSSR